MSSEVHRERNLRSIPPVYAPSFFICHGNKYQNQTFCIPSDGSYHVRSVPEMRGMRCEGSYHGWLILRSLLSLESHLFNPVTLHKIQLPPLPHNSFDIALLTYPPNDPKCVVMFFSHEEKLCILCRVGDKEWIEKSIGGLGEKYRSAVSSNGNIHLFFSQGMAVVDVQDNFDAQVEMHDISDPIVPHVSRLIKYNLEFNGEIFQVHQMYLGLTSIVQKILVFKLDFSNMAWVEVDSLGDKIFLLDSISTTSLVLSASEFGAKGNCLYFFVDETRIDLYCFDMENGTIAVTRPCPAKFTKWVGPCWLVPNCKVQKQKQVAAATKESLLNNSNLPPEMLEMISQSLRLYGCIRFRLASRDLMSLTCPVRTFPSQILPVSRNLPYLISLPLPYINKEICHLYHLIYTDVYTMNITQLTDAIVFHAKFGWLLVSRGRNPLFFFNPLTLETINLPPHRSFKCISFSSPPTSSDCVVFGIPSSGDDWVRMSVYHKIQDRWSGYLLKNLPYTFAPSHCNPVFHNGVFYCLSKDGKIGIFNPKESNVEDMWRVHTNLSVQDVRVTPESDIHEVSIRSFIVESDGDIFSIFVGFDGNPVRVYKLEQSRKGVKWLKVASLGNRVMFLSHTTSLLIPAMFKGTGNRVYLPRFKGNCSVFYSLKSGRYHSFGNQDSWADWIDTCELWNCTWFQAAVDEKPLS